MSERPGTGHDCGGDAAAYVLGALEPAEALRFTAHLERCAICRDEVDGLRGVVQALPMAAPQHPMPRRLRRRVMRAIRDQAASGSPARRPARAPRVWLSGVRGRRLAVPGGAALAAAAAAAAIAIAVSSGGAQGPRTRTIEAQVQGIAGSAQLRVAGGRGELIAQHLSPPPPGHVYEVWLKPPHGPPRPASVLFTVSAAGRVDVGLPESLRGISQVMVTPEPDGGSIAPTHAPVIVATL